MSVAKLNVICILGGPGAGKTTLSTSLTNKIPNCLVLKSGSLIRASLNNKPHDDLKSISFVMDQGGLVDDEVVCRIVEAELAAVVAKGAVHTVVLDGFPRTLAQFHGLASMGVHLSGIIVLEAPELVLEKRCKIRNLRTDRIDDLQQPVVERVQDFRRHIGPILAAADEHSIRHLSISTCGSVEDTAQKAVAFALQLHL